MSTVPHPRFVSSFDVDSVADVLCRRAVFSQHQRRLCGRQLFDSLFPPLHVN